MKIYTYRELKNNPEKLKEFRQKLPWNFASFLYKNYQQKAEKEKQSKPKYSISTIRKVASGEGHNELVLRDLIEIVNAWEQIRNILSNLNKYLQK